MKNIIPSKLIVLLFLLIGISNNAQNTDTKKIAIAEKLNDYFFLERENIHVHFNKDIYLTDESVWFKGYTYHRKSNNPFFSCVNIFATLMDDEGKVLENQLLYGNMGSFSGRFELKDYMKSGRYYVQFYTNWMNNFTEDESFIGEITIVNKNIAPSLFNKPNYSKVNIDLHPEGGTLVNEITNTIGISVTDCNRKPIAAKEAKIINANNEVIKTINLNEQGYGRFNFTPIRGQQYTITTTVVDEVHEIAMPLAQLKGVAISTNGYTVPNKTIITIRVNELMQEALSGKPLYLVIHKDEKATISDIKFTADKLSEVVAFANDDLFEGINTIRILDNELNEVAQRIIYISKKPGIGMEVTETKETVEHIEVKGKVNYGNMNLSISMLPSNTIAIKPHNDIYTSLLINPYLDNQKTLEAKTYLNTISRKNQYEMDLFLLNQHSKYKWRNIRDNPPSSKYTFDIGLSLKGIINDKGSLNRYKVNISSLEGRINETVEINHKNEFFLDNLILADSVRLDFHLIKGDKKKTIKLYPHLSNTNRIYNKQYKPIIAECAAPEGENAITELPELPDNVNTDAIMLEEVEITGTSTELKYERAFGNSQLRGYKISDTDNRNFMFITDLIRYHGFDVEINNGKVGIFGRTVNTFQGQRTQPMIYIDNMIVMSFDILWQMQTEDVDEFYINQHAVFPSVDNRMGIIRIYMKKDFSYRSKKKSPTSYVVKDGFKRIIPFENTMYLSTATKGFENFGTIDWKPLVTTNEKGEFELELPITGQDSVKLLIEGFSPDGKLISEVKTIYLN
ncbi:hypothetical protein [Flavobacterium litorale]|uniref:MG2 domain-containing protein n=1 Tax=Flavobacterium litorale TaxID=2856519 RepID=A0ABX8V340_9FLAO|nr:hypothetical protein [Flavobacterium litorale]QYJ67182.1 hypothetical protein K1I41_06285 [Flavobacterium litorale]